MPEEDIVVRAAGPGDVGYATAAARMIAASARDNEIALRAPEFLEHKIRAGRAALALRGVRLVGFGYWSDWERGAFVSHSGLVVDPERRGRGLGRRLKLELLESSRRAFPAATLMSLTTSPQVKALNLSLGFRVAPLGALTKDPAFWEGCKGCRNYAEVQARGEKCCCEGMILLPDEGA